MLLVEDSDKYLPSINNRERKREVLMINNLSKYFYMIRPFSTFWEMLMGVKYAKLTYQVSMALKPISCPELFDQRSSRLRPTSNAG